MPASVSICSTGCGAYGGAALTPCGEANEAQCEHEWPATIGRFQIEREVGRGGLGVVLLARDPQLGRRVAIKIPRPEIVGGEEARRRYLARPRPQRG